jgi:hypothetical protein
MARVWITPEEVLSVASRGASAARATMGSMVAEGGGCSGDEVAEASNCLHTVARVQLLQDVLDVLLDRVL